MQTVIRCTRCDVKKPVDNFYSYKLNSDGETGRCKTCTKKKVKEWKHENPKVVLMYTQKARLRDPAKHKEKDRQVYLRRKNKGKTANETNIR